jgi:hypothetical protein
VAVEFGGRDAVTIGFSDKIDVVMVGLIREDFQKNKGIY